MKKNKTVIKNHSKKTKNILNSILLFIATLSGFQDIALCQDSQEQLFDTVQSTAEVIRTIPGIAGSGYDHMYDILGLDLYDSAMNMSGQNIGIKRLNNEAMKGHALISLQRIFMPKFLP